MAYRLHTFADRLQQRLKQPIHFVTRLLIIAVLLPTYFFLAIYDAAYLLFFPAHRSFTYFNTLNPQKGYTTSYVKHASRKRKLRFGLVSLTSVLVVQTVLVSLFTQPSRVYAATCNIGSSITLDQSYIDTNSCGDVHITGTPTITFSGAINLSGTGTLYVDNGATVVFSGAVNMTDPSDSMILNGTVTQASANTTGVDITVQTLAISSTGKIDTKGKGCSGGTGAAVTRTGFGPDIADSNANADLKECIQGQGGGGKADRGGASSAGSGGASSSGASTLQNFIYGIQGNPNHLGSGGAGGGNAGENGGTGGGIVRLTVGGTLTVDGAIAAGGTNAASGSAGAGGGSGGSVFVSASVLAGSSTISAGGGNGTSNGGGGGGGRIAVFYGSLSGFTLTNITASKGLAGGVGGSAQGSNGTTLLLDRTVDDGSGNLTITSGLNFGSSGDFTRTNITAYNGANLTCGVFATLNVGATSTLDFQGVTWNCNGVDTINISAGTWTTSNTNNIFLNKAGNAIDFNITNDVIFNNVNFQSGGAGTASATGGVVTMDNPINVSFVNSHFSANVNWTGLASLNIDNTSNISAGQAGCQGGVTASQNGYSPDPGNSNRCGQGVANTGYGQSARGGGAYAGQGGAAHTGQGASQKNTYGLNQAPTLYGSGGAGGSNPGENGGAGGGTIRLDVTGTLTANGPISSDGGSGANTSAGSGGGSGGSVYITTGTLAGGALISANGGNGTLNGGGGGGGRVAVYYDTLSGYPLSNIVANKGLKGNAGSPTDGGVGSTFILNRKADDGAGNLNITSGLDFNSTGDYTRANITVANGAQLSCNTFATLNLGATSTLDFQGVTWTCAGVDTVNLSAGTWTTSNTNNVTMMKPGMQVDWDVANNLTLNNTTWTGANAGSTSANGGVITLDNPIAVSLVNSTLNSSVKFTGLSSLSLDATSGVNAGGKGCPGGGAVTNKHGFSPDPASSNVCGQGVASTGYGVFDRGGAAHGGAGGRSGGANNPQTTTYGSNTAPVLAGSGGAGGSNANEFGGQGGGVVRIDVSGTLTLGNSIFANGFNGSVVSAGGGGGSGGSIYITAGTIAGSGNVQANGGGGGSSYGGGGGGGRVAVYYDQLSGWSTSNISAGGGAKGSDANARAGSVGSTYTLQYSVPSAPTVTAPAEGASNVSRNTTVTGNPFSSDGRPHQKSSWQISDDNTFSDADCSDPNVVWCSMNTTSNLTSIVVNTTNGTFFGPLGGRAKLAPNTTYYVRVQYINSVGGSNWSPSVSFTTAANQNPATPTNSTPANNATGIGTNPTLTSSAFSDPDADAQGASDWRVFESADCSGSADWLASGSMNYTSIVVNTTNGTFADALSGKMALRGHTVYSFQVKHTDVYTGNSSFSSCTQFTTANTAPNLDTPIPTQNLTEDQNSLGAFDLDTYFSDADFNDDDGYNCSAVNGFDAALGTMTINGDRTVDFTLAGNANGSDTVQIRCTDGGSASTDSNTFTVNVASVNDAPSFTKGADETVNEDSGIHNLNGWAASRSTGPSNENSQTLTFHVSTDNDGLFSSVPTIDAPTGNLSYTLNPNANGAAVVSVYVTDNGGTVNSGVDTSGTQTFTITVNAVNDAPTYTKGANQTVLEDSGAQTVNGWATSMSKGPGDESGQTLNFSVMSDNPGLFSAGPTVNVTTGNLTYTPSGNTSGTANVTVTLSDNGGTANGGQDNSQQSFTITVTAVNDVPAFTKGANQTVNEDSGIQTVNNWATGMTKGGGADENSQTLSFNVSTNNDGLFSSLPTIDSATGNLQYTPAGNANGSATVTISLSDNGGISNGGVDTSATQTFTITVNSVNDAPTYTKGANQTVNEDAGAQTVNGWATSFSKGPSDESAQALSFTYITDNDAALSAFAVSATTGNLTYTPAANASGVINVTVTLNDTGGTANGGVNNSSQTFTITINPVNDTPSFTKGANQIVNEDAGAQTVNGWATAMSAGASNESSQVLHFNISTNNDSLFSSAPTVNVTTGNLAYTPAGNANGSATVTIAIADDGGTANSGSDTSSNQTFTITVNSVNDAPSFTKGGDITLNNNSGVQTEPGWATGISTGPSNESSQTLAFHISTNNDALFAVLPAVDSATGDLTYTPAENANGSSIVTIYLQDNGGTANGGADRSGNQTFTFTGENDAPVAHAGPDQEVDESDLIATLDGSDSTDPDSPLTYSWVETLDGSDSCGLEDSLTETPTVTLANKDSSYSCVFQLTVSDGALESSDSVNINVHATNDAPTVTEIVDKSIDEGGHLLFSFAGNDADTSSLTLSVSDAGGFDSHGLSVSSFFTQEAGNVGTFSWTPDYADSGSYQLRMHATDGSSNASRIVNISVHEVDDAPEFEGTLPNISFASGTTTNVLFNLNDYFSDEDDMTFSANGNDAVGVQIADNGDVTMSAPSNFAGTEEIRFTATDSYDVDTQTNLIMVTVAEETADEDVDHVEGQTTGAGIVTVVGKNNEVIAEWQAFPKGGVVPKITTVSNTTYVLTIKNKPGTTLHVYETDGSIVVKRRLSPKVHRRRLDVGNLFGRASTDEIVTVSRRDHRAYVKVFSFSPRTKAFTLQAARTFHPLNTTRFGVRIRNTQVTLWNNKSNTVLMRWSGASLKGDE